MRLEQAELIVKRPHKEVYKSGKDVIKIFETFHPKADVFNEALNTARVEAAGLDIPKVKEVTEIDGKWALVIEEKQSKQCHCREERKDDSGRLGPCCTGKCRGCRLWQRPSSQKTMHLKKNFSSSGLM